MRNPYITLLRTAWTYSKDRKGRFVLIYSMFVVSNIIVASNPLFYGWFINQLQQNGLEVLDVAWIYVIGFVCLRLLEWALHGPARVMERQLAFHVGRNFMDELYAKVLHLPVKWHQENHSGSTISKLRKAHEALRDFFQQGFIYLYSFGKFIFSFAAMLYFSPLFGSIGVALGALTVYIIIQFDKPFTKSMKAMNEREHEVSSTLFDSLSNILTVITLRLENRIQSGFMKKLDGVFPPFKRNVTINELKWFTAQMMVGLIYAVITIGYVYQNYQPGQTFLIGGLIILLGYVNQFTSVFNDIASQYTQIMKYHTDLQNIKGIEKAHQVHRTRKKQKPFPAQWNDIEISDLNFSRGDVGKNGKPTGIHNLNMRIAKGQRIALIGESGSGKSTLLSLLRGLHDPIPGTLVKADKMRVDFESIGSTVTLFPQEPEIFENTVRYNITMGLPFTEPEIMDACEAAQFADVIHRLPQGLDTMIHEKGVNLSGGQRQRLALARGILAAQQSTMILMDEPTSSIDSRTERRLYQNLFDTFKDKAIISSLHRLHLLKDFDYIYILAEGQIIDEGTFENVIRYSLVFKEMWNNQLASANSEERADDEQYPKLNVAL
jgi:ATP-binding cassette, subfamily B, bacterial